MPTRHGFVQGYNAQLAVSADHVIIAAALTQSSTDLGSLVPMMHAAGEAAGLMHAVTGSSDHRIGTVLADAGYASDANLAASGPDRLIALAKGRDQARAAARDPAQGPPPPGATPRQAMSHRLQTEEGHALYKRRGATAEPAIGNLKKILDRFSRRGHAAAASELQLADRHPGRDEPFHGYVAADPMGQRMPERCTHRKARLLALDVGKQRVCEQLLCSEGLLQLLVVELHMARFGGIGQMLLAAGLLAGGCSAAAPYGSEHAVFSVPTGFREGISATTVDVVDIGVPLLYNMSGQRVRVLRVGLKQVPASVQLRSITAHPATNGTIGLGHGDLVKFCRKNFPPYPVTDAVTAPHANSNWYVLLAVSFTHPGRYYLGRVKIFYTAGGQRGWQYDNLFATITITAARPGTKPSFDGCP